MAKKNVRKQAMSLLSLLATIVVVAGGYLLSDNKSSNIADYSYYVNQSKASESTPSQELASSVLTEDVKSNWEIRLNGMALEHLLLTVIKRI